jgi:hypothetical protein
VFVKTFLSKRIELVGDTCRISLGTHPATAAKARTVREAENVAHQRWMELADDQAIMTMIGRVRVTHLQHLMALMPRQMDVNCGADTSTKAKLLEVYWLGLLVQCIKGGGPLVVAARTMSNAHHNIFVISKETA